MTGGTAQQITTIAVRAKADGDRAKDLINGIYADTLGDVKAHNDKVKAKFGAQVSAFDVAGKGWQVAGIIALVLGFGFLFFSIGNLGGRNYGGIHRTTIK